MGNSSSEKIRQKAVQQIGITNETRIQNRCSNLMKGVNEIIMRSGGDIIIGGDQGGSIEQTNVMKNVCLIQQYYDALKTTQTGAELLDELMKSQDQDGLFKMNRDNSDIVTELEQHIGLKNTMDIVNESISNMDATNSLNLNARGDIKVLGSIKQGNNMFNESLTTALTKEVQRVEAEAGSAVITEKIQKTKGFDIGGMIGKIFGGILTPFILIPGLLIFLVIIIALIVKMSK